MRDIAGQTIELGPFKSPVVVPVIDEEGQPRLREATATGLRRGVDPVVTVLFDDDETFTEHEYPASDCVVYDEDVAAEEFVAVPRIDAAGNPELRIGRVQKVIHKGIYTDIEYTLEGDSYDEVYRVDITDTRAIEIAEDKQTSWC